MTVAVLPVKRFALAKQRLRDHLPPGARETLARAMVADVLDTLLAHRALEQVLLVSSEPTLAPLVEGAARVQLLLDPHERGQNAAVAIGIEHALRRRAARVLLVPGDCPALDQATLDELLLGDLERAPAVTAVPDRHGSGTNALLLAPPGVIEPGFGPGSFARHRERTLAVGARWRVARPPALLHDVDTPADLRALRELTAAVPGARTSAVLRSG